MKKQLNLLRLKFLLKVLPLLKESELDEIRELDLTHLTTKELIKALGAERVSSR